MKMEEDQKVTEDARISAEQGAAAQKYEAHVLQVFSCNILFFVDYEGHPFFISQ